MPCYTYGLSAEEQLEEDALLGKGRDPQDDVPGPIDVTGRVQVPLDQRVIGFWLTGLLGAPTASDPVGVTGLNRHVWTSGAEALCSLSTELYMKRLVDTTNRFVVHSGIMVNSLSVSRQRGGAARAEIDLIAQSETEAAASVAGTPVDLGIKTFGQTQGGLLVEGVTVADLTGGQITIGNNLDIVEGLRDDGLIDGADPGSMQLQIELTARYSNTALKQAASSQAYLAIEFGFRDPAGPEILFKFPRVKLPKPRREIGGPGGVDVTYQGRPKLDSTAGHAMTVELVNDVDGATYRFGP